MQWTPGNTLASSVLVMLLPLPNPEKAIVKKKLGRLFCWMQDGGLSLRACFTIRGRGEIAMMSWIKRACAEPSWGNYIKRP
jgi:hypothetical protein